MSDLASLRPERRPGEFVWVVPGDATELDAHAMIREAEGISYVVERFEADSLDLPYDYVAAWITLTAQTALDDVGITATASACLAEAGISCNVLAGALHDHLLVPVERADEALALLGATRG